MLFRGLMRLLKKSKIILLSIRREKNTYSSPRIGNSFMSKVKTQESSKEDEIRKNSARISAEKYVIRFYFCWLTYIVFIYSLLLLFCHKQLLQLICCIHVFQRCWSFLISRSSSWCWIIISYSRVILSLFPRYCLENDFSAWRGNLATMTRKRIFDNKVWTFVQTFVSISWGIYLFIEIQQVPLVEIESFLEFVH